MAHHVRQRLLHRTRPPAVALPVRQRQERGHEQGVHAVGRATLLAVRHAVHHLRRGARVVGGAPGLSPRQRAAVGSEQPHPQPELHQQRARPRQQGDHGASRWQPDHDVARVVLGLALHELPPLVERRRGVHRQLGTGGGGDLELRAGAAGHDRAPDIAHGHGRPVDDAQGRAGGVAAALLVAGHHLGVRDRLQVEGLCGRQRIGAQLLQRAQADPPRPHGPRVGGHDDVAAGHRSQGPGQGRAGRRLALEEDPIAQGPTAHHPVEVVVDHGVLEPREQLRDVEPLAIGAGRRVRHEHGAHLPKIRWPLGLLGERRELGDVVEPVERRLLLEERARAGGAGLVHVALDDLAARDLNELGVLAPDLDDGQAPTVVVVAPDGRRGVGYDLVDHDDAVRLVRERGAQDRRRSLPAGAGHADGAHIDRRPGEQRRDQPAHGVDRGPARAVVQVEHHLAGGQGGQDRLAPRGSQIQAEDRRRPVRVRRHLGRHPAVHPVGVVPGRRQGLPPVAGRKQQRLRPSGQRAGASVARSLRGEGQRAQRLCVRGRRRHHHGDPEDLDQGLCQRGQSRGPAHQEHGPVDAHPLEQPRHVPGDRLEVAAEQGPGGPPLVAEVGHLALGEHRAAGGDGDGLVGGHGQAVGLLDGHAEAPGDLDHGLAGTRRALVALLEPHVAAPVARQGGVTASADADEVERPAAVGLGHQRQGGGEAGVVGQPRQCRRAQVRRVQARGGESVAAADLGRSVPARQRIQRLAVVGDDLQRVHGQGAGVDAPDHEARGRLAKIARGHAVGVCAHAVRSRSPSSPPRSAG